jgi:hypothetical protein
MLLITDNLLVFINDITILIFRKQHTSQTRKEDNQQGKYNIYSEQQSVFLSIQVKHKLYKKILIQQIQNKD